MRFVAYGVPYIVTNCATLLHNNNYMIYMVLFDFLRELSSLRHPSTTSKRFASAARQERWSVSIRRVR